MSTTTSSSSSSRSRSTNHNYTVKNFRGRSLGCYGFSPFSNKNTRSFSTTSTPSGETETTKDDNAVESESSLSNDNNKGATTTTTTNNNAYDPYEITKSFEDTSYYYPPSEETEPKFLAAKYQGMTNEELVDTSTIRVNVNDNDKELLVQWDDALMHSPPVRDKNASLPKGCLVGRVVSTKMQKNGERGRRSVQRPPQVPQAHPVHPQVHGARRKRGGQQRRHGPDRSFPAHLQEETLCVERNHSGQGTIVIMRAWYRTVR